MSCIKYIERESKYNDLDTLWEWKTTNFLHMHKIKHGNVGGPEDEFKTMDL